MASRIVAKWRTKRHIKRGHHVEIAPNIWGMRGLVFHFYCSCGKEWVG